MTTKEKLVEAACGLFWVGLLAIGVWVLVGIVKAQQDPYQGVAPRDVALGAVLVLAQVGHRDAEGNRIVDPNWNGDGNPFEGWAAHDVPGCAPPPTAAKNPTKLAPCKCVAMVSKVQTPLTAQCWADGGFLVPENPAEMSVFLPWDDPPAKVFECLEAVPDHCSIIASRYPFTPRIDYLREWKGYGITNEDRCMTACKPQRCGCNDGVCKAHGETGEY